MKLKGKMNMNKKWWENVKKNIRKEKKITKKRNTHIQQHLIKNNERHKNNS
jgi:hypothetical protein